MSKIIINDLKEQFQHTFKIIYEEVEKFSPEEWVTGIGFFQIPVKQAMHLLDCMDFYFVETKHGEYLWGHRFGGGWWELSDNQMPDKATVLEYARDLETIIMEKFSLLEDDDLYEPCPINFEWAKTRIGLYIYALKHTLHHHGQLSVLAVHHGHDGGSWE